MNNKNITNLHNYDNYKDSGIEWFEKIPEKWSESRVKDFVQIIKGTKSTQYEKQTNKMLPLLNLDYLRSRNKRYYYEIK